MTTDEREAAEKLELEWRSRAAVDFMTFADGLIIDGQRGPVMFRAVMAEFQREAFMDVAPSLEAVQQGTMPPQKRHWWERTKKAGKDSDLAVCLLWLIAFPRRPFYIQVGAADRDQAGIVKQRLQALLFHNAWMNNYVEIQQWKVRSKICGPDGSPLAMMDIMAADIAGAHGGTPDVLVINELSHIAKWEFVENLMDNADGVAQGLVIIATNAGHKGTKAETWRNNAERNKWGFHIWQRPAPWHDEAAIEDARRRNTPSRFKRLWYGRWMSGKGDALNEQDIDRCFPPGARPTLAPEHGWVYIGGLDLGISHDHAGGLVLGVHVARQICRVANYRGWEPLQRTGEVDLIAVEEWCLQMTRNYHIIWLGYDPFQAVYMAQRLRLKNVPMRPVQFSSSKNLMAMASAIMTTIETGKLEAYDDETGRLRRDLGKLTITEKSYGYRLEAVRDETGHADVGTALAICLMQAVLIMAGLDTFDDTDVVATTIEDDLTPEEVEEMPEELRAIYDEDYGDIFSERSEKFDEKRPPGWQGKLVK